MDFYFYGWLISICLWVIFMAGLIISRSRQDLENMIRFNILQTLCLVPMWIFVFLEWGR